MASVAERWNRKLHIYTGLYFLLLLWLFSLSGLILNHPKWKFAEFWEQRKQTRYQHAIVPAQGLPFDQAREVKRQLGLSGELEWNAKKQAPDRLDFRVSSPKGFVEVKADLEKRIANVNKVEYNFWGTLNVLHHMKVVDPDHPEQPRNWVWTRLWGLSVDALSVGLIFMTLSGLYMWWGKRRRLGGILALVLGVLGCGVFLLRF
jgi:hypothetical protein